MSTILKLAYRGDAGEVLFDFPSRCRQVWDNAVHLQGDSGRREDQGEKWPSQPGQRVCRALRSAGMGIPSYSRFSSTTIQSPPRELNADLERFLEMLVRLE